MQHSHVPQPGEIKRRAAMKLCAALGGLGALGSGTGVLQAAPAAGTPGPAGGRIVTTTCTVNCGSRCVLRANVADGAITRIDTDASGDDTYGMHQVRACLRGRSMRKKVYAPDRLKYPMIRTGKRGEARFRRVSWDEALDTIAAKMQDIRQRHGNEAFYLNYATGALGGLMSKCWPPGMTPVARLMNCWGGYLNHYNTYSTGQITTGMPYLYGINLGNAASDMANSKLVVMFGNNPAATRMSGGGIIYDVLTARKRSDVRLIVVDPTFTDTAAIADEWIPIRPGTDAALVAAIAHVLIEERMLDQSFLDTYCVGFDDAHMPDGIPPNSSYKAYVLGQGPDGQAKTPAWAAPICGIPPETIIRLARQIGQARPCCISQGWGPQRHANGEDACRAIALLAVLTGNVGIPGGNTGAREGSFSLPITLFPTLTNPVKDAISVFTWTDAILRGPEMTALRDGVRGTDRLKAPIKFIWNYAGNTLVNQHSDINRTAEILADDTKCEMIVVIDNFMTPSARFADVLLPGTTNLEEDDFAPSEAASEMAYAIFAQRVIEPLFECRDIYDICADLAGRLGVRERFTEGRTRTEWLQYLLDDSRKKLPDLPATLEEAWKLGIFKVRNPNPPLVALKAFRDDPKANPLATPSGKIEIFSKRLWDIGHKWELPPGDRIPALPEFTHEPEGYLSPKRQDFPLQLVTFHYKQRTHSTYGNIPWLKEVAPQQLWINPVDAQARGLRHGETARVFNERGTSLIQVKVTPRVMPGVVLLPEGAWYTPDATGRDRAGSPNVLTSQHPSPLAKGNPQHASLVQVARA
ncbi:dimethyl sulfoxide reductase subunit A [Rhodovastum atsumiense]|uniref:Molybdopterin-dependent oxidoreductase n=1 Tax=Rhodovastum atsumiense TaxID=504468 RepID=A0A5M6IYS2_9PROT|nr:DMSO/selenate family reductase complex A subunit [Rhodovastum atsumiense]KAA5613504.1 molybdopterin-dependent oxidoreductase [Rhodovastum atsumiense]CAH2603251.1 dimethyl sulfoxide reductase subunit A [Rhodovastum atsumiense]